MKKVSPLFKWLVDHIDQSWMSRKGMHYPFNGRDFKELKNTCRSFQEWGVAALWDVFIASDSDWVKKSGYSVGAFLKCLPWLVDNKGWKDKAREYEEKIVPPIDENILELFDCETLKVKEA